MTSQFRSNKDVARSFIELFCQSRFDEAFEVLDDRLEWKTFGKLPFSGTFTKLQVRDFCDGLMEAYTVMPEWIVDDAIAEGSKVALRAHSHGVTRNGFEYNNFYHFLMIVENGKITRVIEYMDTQHAAELVASMQSI